MKSRHTYTASTGPFTCMSDSTNTPEDRGNYERR